MPRAGLSPDVIVDEAARVVDAVGRDRLTLAELATRFGVAQPSLYKHVRGLDDVHRLVALRTTRAFADSLRRSTTGLAAGDALSAVFAVYRDFARAHPGCYGYLVEAPADDDAELSAAADEVLHVLAAALAGLSVDGDAAIDAMRFVRATAHGFVSLELAGGFALSRSVDASYERMVRAVTEALARW